MAYNAITESEIASGKPTTNALWTKVKDCLDYLYGQIGTMEAVDIPNGSFEIDSDSDGYPDNWDVDFYTGGSGGRYSTSQAHGLYCMRFVHPGGSGNGGGYATSDYLECSELHSYFLAFIIWATAAGMKNKVQIQYYTSAKATNGSPVDLYNSTSNPTSPTRYVKQFTPTANSRYFKIILIGGYTDTDVSGSIYFDDIKFGPSIVAGNLPDITYSDNPIVGAWAMESTTSESYIKLKEITISRPGNYTVFFTLSSAGGWVYGRVYKNGSPIGTQRSISGGPTIYSEDFSGFVVGDLIQIYGYVVSGATLYIEDFYCAGDDAISGTSEN